MGSDMALCLKNFDGPYCITTSIKGEIVAQTQDRVEVNTDLGGVEIHMNESTRVLRWRKNDSGFFHPVDDNEKRENGELMEQNVFARVVLYPGENESQPYILGTELYIHGTQDEEAMYMRPSFWLSALRSLSDWWAYHAVDKDKSGYYTNIREHGSPPGGVDGKDKWGYVVSRTLYAFSNAFALSGEIKYLEAASSGLRFLRDKGVFEKNGYLLFNGRMDRDGNPYPESHEIINIFTQFYALTGLIAYYDITRDSETRDIIQRNLRSLKDLFYDPEYGGFYDAISAKNLKPSPGRTDSKSFNSLVDPLSAVLFFLDNARFPSDSLDIRETIRELCEIILTRCVNRDDNFIREIFRRNWEYVTPDWRNPYNTHFLAGNVGGNNKVIWSLLRAWDILPLDARSRAMEAAHSIYKKMARTGAWDKLRGGWYDVMRRKPSENGFAEHMWHANKVWWQQESGILGHLIFYLKTGDEQLLKVAREGMMFWSTNFFDHVNGGVFDTVSCDGIPVNRWKGSWVKGGYHETELARFLYVYLKVLKNEPVDLYYSGARSTAPESVPAKIPGGRWDVVDRTNLAGNIQKATYAFKKD